MNEIVDYMIRQYKESYAFDAWHTEWIRAYDKGEGA